MAQAPATTPQPWSEQLVAQLRGSPWATGLLLAGALVAVFLAASLAVGRLPLLLAGDAPLAVREDIRIGIVLSLLAAYLPAAWAASVANARQSIAELEPVLEGSSAERAALRREVGRYDPRALRLAGVLGIAAGGGVQLFTDWGEGIRILGLPFETYWHRLMLAALAWCLGRIVYATVQESRRFSRIGREQVRIDLLDPSERAALPRRGLHSALLVIGALSLCSLLFFDLAAAPQLAWTLGALSLGALALAGIALALPLRGLRDAVAIAKARELGWCNDEIRRTRSGDQARSGLGLADLIAYRAVVESVREWPLDAPTLRRFALYLGIPLVSWLGGAFVERLLDAALS